MKSRINTGKFVLVFLLTVLIWVWADQALIRELPLTRCSVKVGPSSEPTLWISFVDEQDRLSNEVRINTLVLEGQETNVRRAERDWNDGVSNLNLFLNPDEFRDASPGELNLDVADFYGRSTQIMEWGLTVKSCNPEKVRVRIERLEPKKVRVVCIDENGSVIDRAESTPSQIDMPVPIQWTTPTQLVAYVQFGIREIEQAYHQPIEKTPYIVLGGDQKRGAGVTVVVRMPSADDRLKPAIVTNTVVGYLFGPNLQGRYRVQMENLGEVIGPIAVRATREALDEYQNHVAYHVLLEIYDDDTRNPDPNAVIQRPVIYNFPRQYIDEIRLDDNQNPVIARFRMKALSESEPSVHTE